MVTHKQRFIKLYLVSDHIERGGAVERSINTKISSRIANVTVQRYHSGNRQRVAFFYLRSHRGKYINPLKPKLAQIIFRNLDRKILCKM